MVLAILAMREVSRRTSPLCATIPVGVEKPLDKSFGASFPVERYSIAVRIEKPLDKSVGASYSCDEGGQPADKSVVCFPGWSFSHPHCSTLDRLSLTSRTNRHVWGPWSFSHPPKSQIPMRAFGQLLASNKKLCRTNAATLSPRSLRTTQWQA